MHGRRLPALVAATAIVIDDQCTKAFASQRGLVAHNPAYAFGVVGGPRLALIAGAVVTLTLFVVVVGRIAAALHISPIIPGVVAGGMLGNALDRVLFGGARDFIHAAGAIVNVADLAVAGGLIALVLAVTASLARPEVRAHFAKIA